MKDFFIAASLFLLGALTRLPLVEKIQSHWDGPQYSIAILRYSLSQETPAPPGYPLYIFMGKLLNFLYNDPFYSLLILSVIFSGIGAFLLYLVGKTMFNAPTGVIASFLFLSAPTFYYFGLTAYPYGLIPSIVLMLGLVVFLIARKKKKKGVLLGIIFAVLIGLRPQEAITTMPLYLLGFYYLSKKERFLSLLSFAVIFLLWLIPLVIVSGGIKQYIVLLLAFAKAGALPPVSFRNMEILVPRIVRGMILSFGIGTIFLIYYLKFARDIITKRKKIREVLSNKHFQLFSIWIIPSILFNLLVRNEHAGYQMVYLSSFLILIAYAIWKLCQKKNNALVAVLSLLVVFNLWWFFRDRDPLLKLPYSPTSFHYSEIRKNDLKLGSKIDFIKKHFNPKSSLIITSPDPWRPLMYHLYPYLIYSIDGLVTNDDKFKPTVRESQYWIFKQYNNIERRIIIPPFVETIIFTDDNAINWIKGVHKSVYKLPANSSVTSIGVQSGEKFKYEINLFQKI